jgi:HEAT repeat protein
MTSKRNIQETSVSSDELIRVLKNVELPLSRRIEACNTMARQGYQRFGPVLLWAARTSTPRLAREADQALRRIPGKWSTKRLRELAMQHGLSELKKMGLKTRQDVIKFLSDERHPLHHRIRACHVLADLRVRGASRLLLLLLEHDDRFLANAAAHSLIKLQDKATVGRLEQLIRKSTRKHTREEAVYVLGHISRTNSTCNLLLSLLRNPNEPDHLRGHAASALTEFVLSTRNTRFKSRFSIGGAQTQRVFQSLLAATRDRASQVRDTALGALATRLFWAQEPEAIQAVHERLSDTDPGIRRLAKELMSGLDAWRIEFPATRN